jgi:phage gp29-like protein
MVNFVDQFGRPLRREQLAEPQTSRLAQLQREFAQHPARGLTPTRLARILEDAEQGDVIAQYELFEDMEERDTHILSEMGKRRRALLSLEWSIEPPKNATAAEKAATDGLRELLPEIPDFEDILFDCTDAIGKGFVCQEIEWAQQENVWLPASIEHRPQSWFQLLRGYRQQIRLRDGASTGAELFPFGWITHVHRAKSGYIERAALFRSLVWPYLFKSYSIGDLAEFLEIYGIPMRLGTYPADAKEEDKVTLLRALARIGHDAAGIIPEGMKIDFKDAAEGDPAAFVAMIDWCERSQSKAILGGTLTSQADRGSNTNALGNVHNDVRMDLRDGDAKQIATTLTRDLLYPIAALNFPAIRGVRRCPRFVFNTRSAADLKLYAESLPPLVKAGAQIPVSWVHEQLRIPKPVEGEPVLQVQDEPAAKPAAPPAKTAARRALPAPAERDPTPITAQAGALADQAAPAWTAVLDHVRDLVESAPDLPTLREALLTSYANLPIATLGQVMTMAMTAAELAGRFDVTQESDG